MTKKTTLKRKEQSSKRSGQEPPSKKVKVTAQVVEPTSSSVKLQTKEDILKVEKQILESKQNINLLVSLIQFCNDVEECSLIVASLHSLHRIFTHLWKQGDLHVELDEKHRIYLQEEKSEVSDAVKKYRTWLQQRYTAFQKCLLDYIFCEEPVIQKLSIDIIMELTALELNSTIVLLDDEKELDKYSAIVDQGLFGKFIYAVTTGSARIVIEHLRSKYVMDHHDVMLLVLHALLSTVKRFKEEQKSSPDKLISTGAFCTNVLAIVDKFYCLVIGAEDPDDEMDDAEEDGALFFFFKNDNNQRRVSKLLKSEAEFKKYFSRFWLSFLLLPEIPRIVYQIVLLRMDDHILPNFDNPLILNDFIQASFSKGGFIALLSVKSLFTLITKYNMSYPNFYDKLYSIIEPDVFNMSYRNTFLELLDVFMRSTHLTAYIVAAFVKKLARTALLVPPHACQYLLALIYNLIRRHQQIKFLVHNSDIAARNKQRLMKKQALDLTNYVDIDKNQGIDPFNMHETNLKKSGAMESSLWEIEALKSHYDPAVAKLASSLREYFLENKQEFALKDFLPISYDSEFQSTLSLASAGGKKKQKKKAAQDVPLEFRKKDSLFDKTDKSFTSFVMTD